MCRRNSLVLFGPDTCFLHVLLLQGLDSLAMRCKEYKAAGCKFTKWRSPIVIDVAAGQPSLLTIETNMQDLARYALICQVGATSVNTSTPLIGAMSN
jgi:fructose-bisphosphate aldolase class 1